MRDDTQSTPPVSAERPGAVVLLSGGLDSATTLAIAVERGFAARSLTVRYGQRHANEIAAARAVSAALGAVEHREIAVDLRAIGGSALTDRIPVPPARPGPSGTSPPPARRGPDRVPATYVPARNAILLSLALAWGEVLGADDLFIGVHRVDASGYPDCDRPFLEAFQALAGVATAAAAEGRSRVRVHAPLLELGKADIIRLGSELGVVFGLTTSCYDPDSRGRACGRCQACDLRRRGFIEAGVTDPTVYAP